MANLHSPKLTASFVKAAAPGKYTDGHGLTLFVQPSGSRQWVQRLVIHGRRREMGLGGYPLVTLAEAREVAFANRKIARAGGDPRQQATAAVPTFEAATRAVHAIHAPTWRSDRQRQQWIDEVARVVWPAIGHLPVDAITTSHLTEIFRPIWIAKPVLSARVRQRAEKVMDWAVSQGHRADNPAGAPLKANLPAQPKGQHHKAILHSAVAGAIRAVRETSSTLNAKLAFEFIVLTAARKAEVLGARWDEIDMEAATWTVPASRMKAERDHRVPLSTGALAVLARAKAMPGSNALVFPSARGRRLDCKTLNAMLMKAGVEASPHGFRSSFRDWCSETGKPRELAEAALAHVVRDATEAAYARSDMLELRRPLMQDWAAYLATEGAV